MDGRVRTVLCIDDDPELLAIHQMVLESTGYAVLAASNARAGLELFASHRADAVLLDYGMPEMNGGEVAMVMKAMKPDIPVVMLSALLSLPKDAGSVDVFVTKGQSPEIWLYVLAAVIENRSPCPLDSGLSPFPAPTAA